MARLWLMVHEQHDGPGYGFPHQLWWRDVIFEGGPPDIGERIFFLNSPEEPNAVMHEVRSRYWNLDGQLNIEMRRIVHDPNEEYEKYFSGGVRALDDHESFLRRYPTPWRKLDDVHSTLDERLMFSGWKRYEDLSKGER